MKEMMIKLLRPLLAPALVRKEESPYRSAFLGIITSFIALLFLNSCGGGTSGSGIKSFEGRISESDGRGVSDALISVELTGESSRSNSDGEFIIQSSVSGPSVDFLIDTPSKQERFSLRNISEESSRVSIAIVLAAPGRTPEVHDISIRAWFVGLCAPFFFNGDTIQQKAPTPPGAICSLNVELLGDGERLSSAPLILQYAGCDENSSWQTLSQALTGTGRSAGAAEINFEFKDSPQFCRYRVVLGKSFGNFPFTRYPIDTLTEQGFYQAR